MLRQSFQLNQLAIASLHTGRKIDTVRQLIINPFDLSIAGFYLEQEPEKILIVRDIRETDGNQIIIDSEDVLAVSEDLLRLQDVLRLNYQLIGNRVRTKSKQKLGVVEEFVIDDVSWKIQKIHVKQPLWRNLAGGTLIVDRRQVVEVDDSTVIVEDTLLRSGKLAPQHTP